MYGFTDERGRRQLSARAAAETEQACSLTDNKSGADACRGKLGLSRSLAQIRLHKPSWSPRPKPGGGRLPLDQRAEIHLALCTAGGGWGGRSSRQSLFFSFSETAPKRNTWGDEDQ